MKQNDQDRLLLKALISGFARWEPLCGGPKGEICFGGIRYCCDVDSDGIPMIGRMLYEQLKNEIEKQEAAAI